MKSQFDILIEEIARDACLILKEKIGGTNYADNGDEFYTQEKNVVSELGNYDFSGKIVYCNCDNPSMSKFYSYFKNNFEKLGLRGLYATYYDENPKVYFFNGVNETSKPIKSGRFQDNASIMKKCDVVVTNPPFSDGMPVELIRMVNSMGKKIIMVGNKNMANKKEVFDLVKNGKLNMGYTSINRFTRPDGTIKTAPTAWWTNMDVNKSDYNTGKQYNQNYYPKYDNYDAIECSTYKDIPDNYYGKMGVPTNFLRMINRNQFDILDRVNPRLNGKKLYDRIIIQRKPQRNGVVESFTRKVLMEVKKTFIQLIVSHSQTED